MKARSDVELHRERLGDLDGPRMDDASSGAGQLEHLGVGDARQQSRGRHETRIGGVDPPHVREDFASLGLECRRDRDGRRVRSAAPECRDLHLVAHSLEAGHDDDSPGGELALDPFRGEADNARLCVAAVGLDPGLESQQRHRRHAELVERHGDERRRNPLTG